MIAYRTNYGGAPALPLAPAQKPFRQRVIKRGVPKTPLDNPDPLLIEIGATMALHGISAAGFGRMAVKDPALVSDMQKGRVLGQKVREKVKAFIRELGEGL